MINRKKKGKKNIHAATKAENNAKSTSLKQELTKSEIKNTTGKMIKKLKLLVTIVNRSKALFYTDLLEGFDVNMQMVVNGKGTASSEMLMYLGLAETEKAVIFSIIREDRIKEIMDTLEEKFNKMKDGKGIAYTVPLKSVIGVSVYQFLSNNQISKKGEK